MTDNILLKYPQGYDKATSIFNKFPSTKLKGNVVYNKGLIQNKENIVEYKISKSAVGALVVGVGMLFLSKGVQKNTYKVLERLKNHFDVKLDASSLGEDKQKTNFYEYSVRKLNSFLNKSESINNITSLKDILFMRAMYQTKPTKATHKGISNLFEKLSIGTVKKSYKKTKRNFNKMYEAFDNLDNYIIKTSGDEIVEYKGKRLTKKELVAKAKDNRESVRLVVDAFIMDKTQEARYNCIKEATSQLYSSFWNDSFKGFWSKENKFKRKEMWQTFIAAEQVKGNKTSLAENVAFARNMLSYTDEEKAVFISSYLKNLNSIIPASDKEGADIMKRLEWFVKEPQTLKDNKEIFLKELEKLQKHNITDDKNLLKDKETNIRLIKSTVNDNGTGELQDMIDIYYHIAPFELSASGALRTTKKAISSFDESVNLEIGEFFDKARDLELGSAPTDILTILLSCGTITYGLNKAKSKDEQTSVMLKSGIPIIGAVATTLISATKLVSGGKSLALGFLSGIILNQAGQVADNYRKHLS